MLIKNRDNNLDIAKFLDNLNQNKDIKPTKQLLSMLLDLFNSIHSVFLTNKEKVLIKKFLIVQCTKKEFKEYYDSLLTHSIDYELLQHFTDEYKYEDTLLLLEFYINNHDKFIDVILKNYNKGEYQKIQNIVEKLFLKFLNDNVSNFMKYSNSSLKINTESNQFILHFNYKYLFLSDEENDHLNLYLKYVNKLISNIEMLDSNIFIQTDVNIGNNTVMIYLNHSYEISKNETLLEALENCILVSMDLNDLFNAYQNSYYAQLYPEMYN